MEERTGEPADADAGEVRGLPGGRSRGDHSLVTAGGLSRTKMRKFGARLSSSSSGKRARFSAEAAGSISAVRSNPAERYPRTYVDSVRWKFVNGTPNMVQQRSPSSQ